MQIRLLPLLIGVLWVSLPARAEQTNAPEAGKTALKIETKATGLDHPWGLAFLPDGRMLVTERPGRLRIVDANGTLSEPVGGVPEVAAVGQGGLLDVALAPDFASSQTVFLSYAEPRGWMNKNGTSVARAKLTEQDGQARLTGLEVIFRQEPAIRSGYHFGSRLVFAPDGTLFVTTGERATEKAQAQDPASHLGKVIHITQDGQPAANNPALPGWDRKIWSIGHRNMQGAAIDPATGELWTIEHGARGGDELNRTLPGKNYGWPVITWGIDYSGATIGEGSAKEGFEQPVYYWKPSIAVSGLTFYTGDLFAGWRGNVLVGGLAGARIDRLIMSHGQVSGHEVLLENFGERIRDVRQGPDGAIWVLTDAPAPKGRLVRLSPG